MAATVEELDRRVTALEQAQNETAETLRWVAGTLGRIQAVQDQHTKVLDEHTRVLADHTQRLDRLEVKVDAIPRAVAEQIEASERRLLAAIAGQ